MATEIINFWTWKDSQIEEELKMYCIELEEYDRKTAINELKKAVKLAKTEAMMEAVEDEEQGTKIKEVVLSELQKNKPKDIAKLMLSRVIFHNVGVDDLPYVFCGHNGRAFYIPKEIEVDVPDYILDSCIKDACEERMFPQIMQDGSIKWIKRKIQRFPYSIIKRSFPAE